MATYGWYTAEEAREDWRDAAQLTDDDLQAYLDAAQDAVWAYGRNLTLPDDEPVPTAIPAGWRKAHLLQTRNSWNTSKTDPAGFVGSGEFEVRPFPMDWMVKQLIRPLAPPRPY